MNRFPNKNGSKFGYQKTPTVASSSFGSSSYRKDKGVVDASNITMIKDVDPMLDNITVHGRCISLWHSHRMNQAHNPYSLDMVLQDSQNSRIQVYIKKEWMFRFEPLFQEGQCYAISNFAIAENSGKLPLLPHKYKISFYKGTVVTRIDSFDNNVNGFILEPFNHLLDGTRQYHEHEAVVVDIGDIVLVQSAAGQKIRRTVIVEDSESLPRDCSFYQWANIEDAYVQFLSKSHCIVYARIHKIYKENGWAYTAFKECNKKVNVVESKAMSSAGKSNVTFYYEHHGAYKVIMKIIDQFGSAPIVVFNTMINKLSGYTAWELMEKHSMDVDEYWPGELLDLVGKRCDAVNDEPAFVKHFKEGFLDEEDDVEGFTTPASRIKVTNLGDDSVNRVLDMQTPTSGNEASGSGESSGSKRVFIDLDDIDSDEDEEVRANKTPKLLTVKVEKEDP
ncbi:replication protein A 70 kDa DNA-binding subunit B [Tanacetum coccineum]